MINVTFTVNSISDLLTQFQSFIAENANLAKDSFNFEFSEGKKESQVLKDSPLSTEAKTESSTLAEADLVEEKTTRKPKSQKDSVPLAPSLPVADAPFDLAAVKRGLAELANNTSLDAVQAMLKNRYQTAKVSEMNQEQHKEIYQFLAGEGYIL